jgi:hypothetical protein
MKEVKMMDSKRERQVKIYMVIKDKVTEREEVCSAML